MQYQTNHPYATSSQQYGAGSHPREEQRRRQQEYSRALAQQVAQREQQKRREREMDQQFGRRNSGFQNQPQQGFQQASGPGFLDGLGRNNHQNPRTSLARGHPQLHHRLPGGPESFDYSQANNFTPTQVSFAGQVHNQLPVDNQVFQGGFGFPVGSNQHQPAPQQSWQHQQSVHNDASPFVSGPGSNMQTGWVAQNPQQKSMSQARSSQFWPAQGVAEHAGVHVPQSQQYNFHPQAEPPNVPNGGRRQRTDIHDGSRGDSGENEQLRRKLQQQHEMQLALERQIEEKRQQKLEAKRRQEEEDRRELERFEEDQRRQRAEHERIQEEKRRKAELEQQKADQAAAAVAAANQQAKTQQQQKLHAQISQAQIEHPQHAQPFQQQQQHFQQQPQFQQQQQHFQPQFQQPERFPHASSPNRSKNPFTNSRAHLFEDPLPQGSPQRDLMPPNNHLAYSNQNSSPSRGNPQSFGQTFQHENNVVGRSIDPTELRRQYNDMREELRRQKQLVDQLRQAQEQIQHQQQHVSPKQAESGNVPTLMDLEKLRNELREELAYREQLHQQELASLKREQQQEKSPHRYPSVKNSVELRVRGASSKLDQVSYPANISGHKIVDPHREPSQHQRDCPIKRQQAIEHLDCLDETPLAESLRGESKFVYFDGRVGGKTGKIGFTPAKDSKENQHGEPLHKQSESTAVEASQIRKSTQKSFQCSPIKLSAVKKSVAASVSIFSQVIHEDDTDNEDDAHEFVIAGIPPIPSHKQFISSPDSHSAASSHRYSQLPPPTPTNGKWRLESMGTNDASDSDDDLDATLDGEQLEALFQRNVRRHEILLGFQSKVQGQPQHSESDKAPHTKMAWMELHQQLESNRRASFSARRLSTTSTCSNGSDPDDEAALVASSKWMPSLLQPKEHTTNVVNR